MTKKKESHKTSHKKKKRVKSRTKHSSPKITQTSSEVKVEKILIENFVSLQKVMTNLSLKFDNLANQMSKLLNLFEISAKALAKKELTPTQGLKEDKKILEKLDTLADQNKIIAKGLTLLHESESNEENFSHSMPKQFIPIKKPLNPPIPSPIRRIEKPSSQINPPTTQTNNEKNQGLENYQKSISEEEDPFPDY